jgi:hypothetical protein
MVRLMEQGLKLVSSDLFLLKKQVCTAMKYLRMLYNDCLCLFIAVINNAPYFFVNFTGNQFTVTLGMSQISSDKHFIVIAVVIDHADVLGHAVPCYHIPGCLCGLFNIAGSPGGNIAEDNLLRNPAAERYHNVLKHLPFGNKHLIVFRKGHGVTGSA